MNFGFSEEQELLRHEVRKLLDEQCPMKEVRRLGETPEAYSPALWKQLGELGWLGLQVSYHAGWIRPYTNWFRSIPIEEVREFPEKLRDLLGYKTYNGIGSVNRESGSYRESYRGKGRPRPPRLSLD